MVKETLRTTGVLFQDTCKSKAAKTSGIKLSSSSVHNSCLHAGITTAEHLKETSLRPVSRNWNDDYVFIMIIQFNPQLQESEYLCCCQSEV